MKFLKSISRCVSNLFSKQVRQAMKKPRNRPTLEKMEDRATPAVVFQTHTNGTFAYNTSNGNFRQISPKRPTDMTEGADGTLYASYDTGTWRYTYANNQWTKLSAVRASDLDASDDNTLYASFGNGTYRYSGGWTQITTAKANELAVVDYDTFYGSFSNGTFLYDRGSWKNLTPKSTEVMAVVGTSLLASYNTGTWVYQGSWKQLSSTQAITIGGSFTPPGFFLVDPTAYYVGHSSGVKTYSAFTGSGTSFVTSKATQLQLEVVGSGLTQKVLVFGSFGDGTWVNNAGKWTKTTAAVASQIAR